MTDREDQLAGLRAQVGGIDPVLDAAGSYTGAVRELGKTVRQQGQVMSATLANNHVLYHTNRKMTAELREERAKNERLERERENMQIRLNELEDTLRGAGPGGSPYKALYEKAIKTLNAYSFDLLDHDQLKERMDGMKAQAAELAAQPETIKAIDIARGGYAEPYNPEAVEEAHRESIAAHMKEQNKD